MSLMGIERWHSVQQFLFREAQLLDERRFDDWIALFAPDAEYWVPSAWEQASPKDHVSLFYETVALLRMRVDRLARGLSPLDTPQARVNHYLSNLIAEEAGSGTVLARAHLLYAEYRRDEIRWFPGRCTWQLRAHGSDYRIASKRVDLLNGDQDSGHLRFAIPF